MFTHKMKSLQSNKKDKRGKILILRKKEPILGTVIVTDKCNLKCKHCSVNNITAVVHPYKQIRDEMQQLYDMGVRILFFCGGETFLWRDGERTLKDLVVDAKQMGFLIVNVVTNGTFPVDERKLPTSLTLRFSLRQRMVYYLFWTAYSTKVSAGDFEEFFGVPKQAK